MDDMMQSKARAKLSNRKGFTLLEMLLVTVMAAMLSGLVGTGVVSALRQYNTVMQATDAQILYSTLSSLISYDLENCSALKTAPNGTVTAYQTTLFRDSNKDNEGRTLLAVGDTIIVENGTPYTYGNLVYGKSSADCVTMLNDDAYALRARRLGATVKSLTYDKTTHQFTVELSIAALAASTPKVLYSESFTVINLFNTEPE